MHAHLGLATTEVLLARWPAASDVWSDLVRPTLYEVPGLCHALAALDLSNRLADI